MQCVDDAVGSPCRSALNRLGIKQVRIHSRLGSDKPGAKMIARLLPVNVIAGKKPSGCQRRHLNGERNHNPPMFVEILWIALPISIHVRPIWIFRVRPEVIRLGIEIVKPTCTSTGGEGCYRRWRMD